MSRIPGSREDKHQFLSGLDQRTFVELVADILYFVRGHRDVKIVDGPGDGRRDIHSHTAVGAKHLAQCKFHTDPGKTVGSRETDELPIAMLKFGANQGTFATSGRLSPQAAREYLEHYPDFQMSFLDGADVVDRVLSNPVMASVWFDGSSISSIRHYTRIPLGADPLARHEPYRDRWRIDNRSMDAERLQDHL